MLSVSTDTFACVSRKKRKWMVLSVSVFAGEELSCAQLAEEDLA